MYKILQASKDTYITDRVIRGTRKTQANVGAAGTLDLWKLYGTTQSGSSPNIELSRLLVQFDLDPIRELVAAGKIDTNNPSFECRLKLFDVYGGQPTPRNFDVTVHPLSRSFDEGQGRDIVFYGDSDVCNFLTSSRAGGPWILSGANQGGHMTGSIDYVTTALLNNVTTSLEVVQNFETGEENLDVNVTQIVSATLAGTIPDAGFRIALTSSLETNTQTYFVKRFASRTAYDRSLRPQLIVKYDDSIQDDATNLFVDSQATIFLHAFNQGSYSNLTSGSNQVTGSSSLKLRLVTPISGGFYSVAFTGSQHTRGINAVTGMYSASIYVSGSNSHVTTHLTRSGSVSFTPIWESLDGSVAYHTGSVLKFKPAQRGGETLNPGRFYVSVTGVRETHRTDETLHLRVNVFDPTAMHVAVKTPVQPRGLAVRDVHYQVRDSVTNTKIIPFDLTKNSTRVSSDASGMFFSIDASSLIKDRSYVIDIMVTLGGNVHTYQNASAIFRVTDLQ